MITRSTVVQTARECVGTPFFHCGRQPGKGLDCIGLLVAAYTSLRMSAYDVESYSRIVPPGFTRQKLSEAFIECPANAAIELADVLLFQIRGVEQHVGIYVGEGLMVHAYQHVGRVVEQRLDDWWSRHIAGVFKYRWEAWLP